MKTRPTRWALITAAVLLAVPLASNPAAPALAAVSGDVELASIDSGEGGGRELPAISADGDRIVFVGRGESNQGLWLRDRSEGATYKLVSGSVFNPAISADGDTAAYVVYGANRSVFVRDITDPTSPGPAVLVSKSAGGTSGGGLSDFPTLSGDGRFVAFQSTSTSLDPTSTLPGSGGPTKVYLHDRDLSGDGTFDQPGDFDTRLVSEMVDGTVPPGNATRPDITPDGSQLAIVSEQLLEAAPVTLAAEEEEVTATQIWKVEVTAGDVTDVHLVSHAPDGSPGDLGSGLENGPTLSDDGTVVAFESQASNLVAGDLNADTDAFVEDDGTVVRVSVSGRPESLGAEVDLTTQTVNPCSGEPWLDETLAPYVPVPVVGANAQVSGDGSFVAFQSQAALTVDDLDDTTGRFGEIRILDVYGYDVASETVERLSQPLPEGSEATGCRPEGSTGILGPMTNGGDPTIGTDRTYVAFGSNGDLAAERPVPVEEPAAPAAEEEEEGTSTETAVHLRTYGALGVGAFVRDAFVLEGDTQERTLSLLVGLTAPAAGPTSVDLVTADLTATAGADYVATVATVDFAAGEIASVVEVPVMGDIGMELDETFSVTIAVADVTIGAGVAEGTIGDDDDVGAFNEHYATVPFNVTGDYVPIVGDFDGDGTTATPDVLWYAAGPSQDYLWHITGVSGSLTKTQSLVSVSGDYQPIVSDFDDNGRDDIFWYAAGSAPDFVWFATTTGFQTRAVSVTGTYRPVATIAGGQPAVFWHAPGLATDYLWVGNTDRTFTSVGAPQVRGTYLPVAIQGPSGDPGILWYAPGPTADFVWSGLAAGPTAPADKAAVTINGTYQPVSQYPAVLLYGPGSSPDFLVGFDLFGPGFGSLAGSVTGDYTVGASPTIGTVVWHAPGAATDYLWTLRD